MKWSWFDLNWPWVGLALSAILLLLLFATSAFRSEPGVSRWRDPVWLSWLAPAAYMLHQFEEYGIDAFGTRFAFPDLLCTSMGLPPYPSCSLPTAVFVAINIPVIWIAGVVCGLLSKRHSFVGLGLYAMHFTNSLSHLGVAAASGAYNPGALTAALIQLPLSLWVAHACFGREKMRRYGIAVTVLAGALFSVILLGSVQLFTKGSLSATTLVTVQVINPLFVVLLPWMFENGVLSQPQGNTT